MSHMSFAGAFGTIYSCYCFNILIVRDPYSHMHQQYLQYLSTALKLSQTTKFITPMNVTTSEFMAYVSTPDVAVHKYNNNSNKY